VNKEVPPLLFDHFWRYDEVMDFISRLAAARPELVKLSKLGQSREGRDIPLLTITDNSTGAAEDKPAYLIHGNIHAAELSGTHAALYTARQLLVDPGAADLLKRIAFYIVPRLNPDGAEFIVTTSGRVRSRTDRTAREPNTLYQQDLNDDGLILTMRQLHPDGPFVVDAQDTRLLIRRRKEHQGSFYRLLPEGLIHDWDGSDNIRVEGRSLDWNRNWSYDWRPEPEQPGAGDFPFSEPEMRAMAEFIHSHPNLFAILGYHTGPGAVLRPPSTGSDTDLLESDWQVLQELAQIGAEATGLPIYPAIKYHAADKRDINLRGHFHNFGYHHLGLYVFEFELGILANSAGITTEELLAATKDEQREAIARRLMAWWDQQEQRDPVYVPWTPFSHPQLGRVEIGGLLRRHLAGRTLPDLERIAQGTYRFTLEHASRHPRITVEDVTVDRVASEIYRLRIRVANRGQFPTHISEKGKSLRRLRPLRVEIHLAHGAELLSCEGHRDLGHLAGLTDSRMLEWFIAVLKGGTQQVTSSLAEIRVFGGTGGNLSLVIPMPK